MNDKKENKLIPYLLAFIPFFLYFAPFYINYLSLLGFFSLFSLAPLFIGFYKYGNKFFRYIVLFFVIIIGVIYFIAKSMGINYSINIIGRTLNFIVVVIVPGIIYNFTHTKKYGMKKSYSIFIYYALFVVIVVLVLLSFKSIYELVMNYLQVVDKQFNNSIQQLKTSGVPDEAISQYIATKNMLFDIIQKFFPSIIFVSLLFYFTLNLLVGKLFISIYYEKRPMFIELFKIRASEYLIWLFIISWGLLFVSLIFHFKIITNILFNLSIIISTIYLLQGVSIILFRLLLLNMSVLLKSILLGAIFIILILSIKFFLAGIIFFVGIGILDYWIDFIRFDNNR